MYLLGVGVAKSDAEAVAWYRKSANQGYADSQAYLGDLYADGLSGLPKSYEEAAKWYQKAGEQGHGDAQWSLGNFYRLGRGVPRDLVRAYACYSLARHNGWDHGDSHLEDVARRLTKKQIAEAQKLMSQ
jgi:TPR repeat protein